MNNIKNVFSIKDLENLTGIKAHTIRMWEKRYKILKPERTDTNIRLYPVDNLQKLLNVTLLNRHGYKISKIATMPDEEIPKMVREIVSNKNAANHAMNAFVMAMMNFDQGLFFKTYNQLLSEKPLQEVFFEVIIPFLEHTGLLWQTGTISPAHEHFISYLIRQKILILTEEQQHRDPVTDRNFVLFLPTGEVHELGLMYIHYDVLRNGHRSIYLGENIPLSSLADTNRYFDSITYITYFTTNPHPEEVQDYVKSLEQLLKNGNQVWIIGRNAQSLDKKKLPDGIRVFDSIRTLTNEL